MIFLTGDIHGNPTQIQLFLEKVKPTEKDTIVLLGDVGANYYGNKKDKFLKNILSNYAPTFLCIHGNHEMRPEKIVGYKPKIWNGGRVLVSDDYPNILFAEDGEVYDLEGHKALAIGGAYSVDKFYRLERGFGWWADEQPSELTKRKVEDVIAKGGIDIILSHTCPYKYRPTEMFISGLDQSTVDESTELWLDKIEEAVDYKEWYCGHWHTDKHIDKMHFLFRTFEMLKEVKCDE